MGEISGGIINGEYCQDCGQALLTDHGHAVSCTECGGKAKLCADASEAEMKAAGWKPSIPKEVDLAKAILHGRQQVNAAKRGNGHYDGSQGLPEKVRVKISELKKIIQAAEKWKQHCDYAGKEY